MVPGPAPKASSHSGLGQPSPCWAILELRQPQTELGNRGLAGEKTLV